MKMNEKCPKCNSKLYYCIENEVKLAWKKIENMYYTMELKIPEESQEDIPMFEDLKKAIRKLISIEKSWNDINMASCYRNEEDCVC